MLVWLSEGRLTNAAEINLSRDKASMRRMLDVVCALALEQLREGRHVILYGFEHQQSLWGDLNSRNTPGANPHNPLMPLQELINKKKLYNVAVRMCKFHVKGPQTGKGSNKVIIIISDYAFPHGQEELQLRSEAL